MINLAEFAIRQRKFVLFFIVLSVITGIYSYFDLGKLEDPSFTVKTAVVVTLYPGASAEEVEHQVTDTVETKLQEMAELDRLRSLSRQVCLWSLLTSKRALIPKHFRKNGTY